MLERIFSSFSQIVNDGLLPNMKLLIDFLLGDGLFLGLVIIFLPLTGKIINIFRKIIS